MTKTLYIISIVLFFYSCKSKQEVNMQFKAAPISEWTLENLSNDRFENCKTITEWNYKKFTDCKNIFSIQIPSLWHIVEDIVEDTHGIVSSDTTKSLINSELIIVTEIENDSLELDEYFRTAIFQLFTTETKFEFMEAGESKIGGKESFWLSYVDNSDSINYTAYLYYLKNNNKNRNFYLIESGTYGSDNIEQKQCMLRQVVGTFTFLD